MLMQRLVEYARRLDETPTMYKKVRVKWLVDLDKTGTIKGIVPTAGGGKKDKGKEFWAPTIGKSSGINAKLLCENAEYVFGLPREDSKKDPKKLAKVLSRHKAFVQLVSQCAESTKESTVEAVSSFLAGLDRDSLQLPEGFNPTENLSFRVGGTLPIELPSVQAFWANQARPKTSSSTETLCLSCGATCIATDRMPIKINSFGGGQSSGLTLVSANAEAYESYGMKASQVAPVCSKCAELHAKGLNDLLGNEATRIFLGPLAYVFWTREEQPFNAAALLSDPQPEDVKQLLDSARRGTVAKVDAAAFFAAAFSPSGGRVVVRDWLETTVGLAKGNLARWFQLQSIADVNTGDLGKPLPMKGFLNKEGKWVNGLCEHLCPEVGHRRDLSKLSPQIPKVLLHAALHGGPLPYGLLFEAVKRNRAEQALTQPRAALIKMVMLSQKDSFEEGFMEKLDIENVKPAYLCGRLLAELEALQYAALGKTNTTVTSRFYGTASSAPASVFGRLMRGAQAHLSKLRTAKPATYEALEQRLEEIQTRLPAYPLVLTLEDQGLFALGYYHQRAQDRADRIAYAETKKAEAAEKAE